MSSDAPTYCTALKRRVGDEDPLEVLARTASRIQSLISGVDETVLRRRPCPDKWSIAEIIAHLADSELVFGYRLRMIICANGSHLQAFDPDAWASTLAYDSCDVHVAAEVFRSSRMGNLHMLGRIAGPLIDNSGTHEQWGTETARGIILLEAGHDLNHLAQIERLLDGAERTTLTPSAQEPEVPIGIADQVDLRIGTIVQVAMTGAKAVAEIVQRFDAAWQRGDIDTLMSLIADDCVYDASVGQGPGTEYAGKQAVRRGFVEMLAYDDGDSPPGQLIMADGSRALMVWSVQRTTASGERMTVRGCDIFEVRDGLIRRKDAFRKSVA